jgi:2-polyprenyl-3-methyl-5-hydroxy-6-metoxy-1,4-benzoquinol methylase
MFKSLRRTLRSARRRWGPQVGRHRQISQTLRGDLHVIEIAREETLTVHIDGKRDTGYHRFGNDWWLQPRCPHSFKYLSIDTMYPDAYFDGHGHPEVATAQDLVDYMQGVFSALFGRDLHSILELGSGGGEITKVFSDRNLDFVTVEGTAAGVRRLHEIGIAAERILQHNLKFMPALKRKFDLVMCTEVAEHIEPFFASKVVENCIRHGDAVWFSAADRNRAAHYHHIAELPMAAWDNLFAHMGFAHFVELDGRHERASRIYLRHGVG